MINFIWKVTDLYTVNTETATSYVVNAMYEVVGSEEKDGLVYTAELSDMARFKVKQNSEFIAYESLTNDIVIDWIKSELGETGVSNLQASIAGQINSKKNPPVPPQNVGLPPNFN